MARLDTYKNRYPILSEVIQDVFPHELKKWIRAKQEYFTLLEEDLKSLLNKAVSIKQLRNCYKDKFIKEFSVLETIHEIHFGSELCKIGDSIELKVPTSVKESRRNFDFRIRLGKELLNFEVETRKDIFPFREQRLKNSPIFVGRREVADQRLLGRTNLGTPESTIIRYKIQEALDQLPHDGINFIALGQTWCARNRLALTSVDFALYGDKVPVPGKGPTAVVWNRLPNGLFSGTKEFKKYNNQKNLSSVNAG